MVNESYNIYVISNSERDYDKLKKAKKKLLETYDKIENEKIEKTVKDATCWKLIHDMTGRK